MRKLSHLLVVFAGLLAGQLALPLHAAPGSLDATFGNAGKVIANVYGDDRAACIAVQPDGKVLVGGTAGTNPVLLRFLSDGNLDESFGNRGKIIDAELDQAKAVLIQPDGKILVTGPAGTSGLLGLARYNSNGSLDLAFGGFGVGKTYSDIGVNSEFATGVALQPDQKIVVIGYSLVSSTEFLWAVVRYKPDGTRDTGFGDSGKVVKTVTNGRPLGVAVQPDGKILVAGDTRSTNSADFVLVRYLEDGSLDPSFGNQGIAVASFGARLSSAYDLAVQPDGKVVLAGVSTGSSSGDFALARFTSGGLIDPSFGSAGLVLTDIGTNSADNAQSVALQPDGKILVGGECVNTAAKGIVLVRYNANGSLDPKFGNGGKLITVLGSSTGTDFGADIAIQPDGNILQAGSFSNDGYDIAVLRYEGGPFAPVVTATAATQIARTTATLTATVKANNADTAVGFEYGLTRKLGSTAAATPSPVTGLGSTGVSAVLNGLLPHTTYYFQANAMNSEGRTDGSASSFRTLNTAPQAIPDSGVYDGSEPVLLDVLGNDSDGDGDPVTVESFTQGACGTVTWSGTKLLYTPGAEFFGSDAFSYTINDGFGGNATSTVSIVSSVPITQIDAIGATPGKVPTPGDAVPGEPEGTTFRSFGIPAVNGAGMVAFLTTLTTSAGNVPAVFDGSRIVVRKGDAAPGVDGLTLDGFMDPALNDDGSVAFLSRLRGRGAAAKGPVLYTNLGGTLLPAVRVGEELPGIPGAKLRRVTAFQLLNGGLLFSAQLGGVPANSASVVCAWTPATGVQVLLRARRSLEGRTIKTISALLPAGSSTGQSRYASAKVAALARVTFIDGTQAVVEADATGVRTIAQTAGPVPTGITGAQWKSFGVPIMNSNGDAAFVATLAPGPGEVERGNDTAIFAEIEQSPLQVIAREGQIVTDRAITTLTDPVFNSRGDVAALVTLSTSVASRAGGQAVLFASKGSSPALIARSGDEAPGVPDAKFKGFKTVALPDDLGPIFVATLARGSGDVTSSNETGLWAQDSNGTLHLLVRERDNVKVGNATKTLRGFTVLSLVTGSPNQTRAFNSAREITYKATFTDGSQAVLCIQVP